MMKKVNTMEYGKALISGSGFYHDFFAWTEEDSGYLVSLKIEEIDNDIENWVWFVTHVSDTKLDADAWTQMRRLSAVLFLVESHGKKESKLDVDARAEQIMKMSYKLKTNIVSEFLGSISLNTKRWHSPTMYYISRSYNQTNMCVCWQNTSPCTHEHSTTHSEIYI